MVFFVIYWLSKFITIKRPLFLLARILMVWRTEAPIQSCPIQLSDWWSIYFLLSDVISYHNIVGALQYLILNSPEISFAVNQPASANMNIITTIFKLQNVYYAAYKVVYIWPSTYFDSSMPFFLKHFTFFSNRLSYAFSRILRCRLRGMPWDQWICHRILHFSWH